MRFGEVPIASAIGAVLAHGVTLPDGVLKKGRVLSAADVSRLEAAGKTHVVAATMDPGDVAEDLAAAQLAAALAGRGVRVAAPFTGRANLYATAAGLLSLERDAIDAVNAIDESLTVATLAPHERVIAGQMIGTVKVIPFAVRAEALTRAVAVAPAAIRLAPFRSARIGLVLTTLPALKDTVLAKRRAAIADRIDALGATLTQTSIVPHTSTAVAQALRDLHATDVAIGLVFSATAIVDRADTVPAGLVAAGGRIRRLGMPVDPGNLLLLGDLDGWPVVGIPSCAASPKLNGFDWVLERLVAGVPVTAQAIAAMGVGGLLKEIPTRPQPREGITGSLPSSEATSGRRTAPKVACLILAAGRATRMGSNKLLEPLDGRPIVRHVVDAALASDIATTLVVTGHEATAVRAALTDTGVTFLDSPRYADGIAASLKAGLAAVPDDADAVLVALGDMPDVTAAHINRLIAAYAPADGRTIIVPTHDGKRGNPVLWGRMHLAAMSEATGDTGAKHLIGRNADAVVEVDLGTDAIFLDVDTPAALAARRAAGRGPGRLA